MSIKELAERLPINFLAHCLVSGTIILILSPATFLLPLWLRNPLSADGYLELLGRCTTLVVLAFVPGAMSFFFKDALVGDKGLFRRTRQALRPKKAEVGKAETALEGWNEDKEIKFVKWVHKNHLQPHVDFLYMQNAILNGLLVGSGSTLFSFMFGLPFLFVVRVAGYNVLLTDAQLIWWYSSSLVSLILMGFGLAANRSFKPSFRDAIKGLRNESLNAKSQQQDPQNILK